MSEKDSAAVKEVKEIEFNLDDESTWPDNVSELADIAGKIDPGAGHVVEGGEGFIPEIEAEAAIDSKKEPETPAEEPPAPASDKAADGILAKDGKNVLPMSVLQNEREKSADLQRQLDEEKEQSAARLAELEAKANIPADDTPDDAENTADDNADDKGTAKAPVDDTDAEIDRLNKLAAEVFEEYDDDKLAESYRAQARLLKRQQVIEQRLNDQDASRKKQEQDTATNEIQDALDSSPLLTEWANNEDKTNHDRATQLNTYLIRTDKEYAAMNWQERFKVLPSKVSKLYDIEDTGNLARKPAPVDVDAAKDAASKASTPTSMSDITGGNAPAGTEAEALETMSPNSVMRKMEGLADDDALEAYLRDLS